MMGMTSCANDLNISSIDPQTSTSYEDMELLAKVYGTLGMTGQKGPAGAGDISSDEGESGFYRTTFNLQTLPTDECNWAWQTDTDIPQITGISWNANSSRTQWAYQRSFPPRFVLLVLPRPLAQGSFQGREQFHERPAC